MGIVPSHTTPSETYHMKLQHFISKVEECRALANLYEELRGRVAQVTAYEAVAISEEMTDEQRQQIADTGVELRTRLATATQVLCDRVGQIEIDNAIDRVDELQTRVEQIHQVRREQVSLRATLDVELAMADLPQEQRQQAETSLIAMQNRMETALTRAEALMPSSRLVKLH